MFVCWFFFFFFFCFLFFSFLFCFFLKEAIQFIRILFYMQDETRTVFSEEYICPRTSLNRYIVKIDCIYNKLKDTIYLFVSLVRIHPFLNEIGC